MRAEPPLSGVSVTVFNNDGDEVTSTVRASDGTHQVIGLPECEYTLHAACPGVRDAIMTDINVLADKTWEALNVILFPIE